MNKYAKIAEGLASWLVFEQRCGRENLFCESYLSYPLGQLLKYRYPGRVLSEVEHPVLIKNTDKSGRKPCIDYAVANINDKFELVVEAKWVSKSPTLLQDIIVDIIRLELLLPIYAKEAIFILCGKAKNLNKLFQHKQFSPHKEHITSRYLLPIHNHINSRITIFPGSKFRKTLFSKALRNFKGLELSNSIYLKRSGPYPHNVTSKQYVVYIWLVSNDRKAFKCKPEKYYTF